MDYTLEYKKAGFKVYLPKNGNGTYTFICKQGHKSNYLLGSGSNHCPYKCPECNNKPNTVGGLLHQLNNKGD